MNKKLLTIAGILSFASILLLGVDVKNTCACSVPDQILFGITRSAVNSFAQRNEPYPTFDALYKHLQTLDTQVPNLESHFHEWNKEYSGMRDGVYYAPIADEDGTGYTLKWYAPVMFFGYHTPVSIEQHPYQ